MIRFVLGGIWLACALAWGISPSTPLYFERNSGQTESPVRYLARTQQATVFVTDHETVFSLRGQAKLEAAVRMSLPGSDARARWTEEQPQPLTVASYVGSPEKWRESIPTFSRLRRPAIYPGIDLIYYGTAKQMEYDFVLQPGAHAHQIRLRFDGAQRLQINAAGDLEIATNAGTLIHHQPRIYQRNRSVAGRYRLFSPTEAGIEITSPYDHRQPLTIDPVVNFSSFYGGEGDDRITASYGSAIAGYTNSIAFPGANVKAMGGYDAFFMSFGSTPRIIYIGGETDSRDFPLFFRGRSVSITGPNSSGPYSISGYAGGASDAFLYYGSQNFDGGGTFTSYSTLLGGTGRDRALALTVASETVYLAGDTDSPDLPANGLQSQHGGGKDGFATSYNLNGANGSATRGPLTYWGGAGDDSIRSISQYNNRWALAGTTTSDGLPTVRPVQSERRGGVDGYITVANGFSPQSTVAFASYWGGSGDDAINTVINRAPLLSLFGTTSSPDLKTEKPAQAQYGGGDSDAFITTIDLPLVATSPSRVMNSTYWGGSGRDTLNAAIVNNLVTLSTYSIAVEREEMLLAGSTDSPNFPLREAVQSTYAGGNSDAWLGLFSIGAGFSFSSYYGGSGTDEGIGIGQDPTRQILLAGHSDSSTLLGLDTIEGYDRAGATDAFVARLSSPSLSLLFNGLAAQDALTSAILVSTRLPGSPGSRVNLRARSSDPAKLTVSFSITAPGQADTSITWGGESITVYLHGMSADGSADVILSADGFPERRFPVTLRPLSGQISLYDRGNSPIDFARPVLKVGRSSAVSLGFYFRAFSADNLSTEIVSYPRPGIPAAPVVFSSSDSSVLSIPATPVRWTGSVNGFSELAYERLPVRLDRAGNTRPQRQPR